MKQFLLASLLFVLIPGPATAVRDINGSYAELVDPLGGQPGESVPRAQVSAVSSYVDTDVEPGTVYHYKVRSRDAAGNEHEASREVSASTLPE